MRYVVFVEQKPETHPLTKTGHCGFIRIKRTMDVLVAEDTQRYREALWEAGGVFGGIEPIQRFHEAFQGPVDAAHTAAAVRF